MRLHLRLLSAMVPGMFFGITVLFSFSLISTITVNNVFASSNRGESQFRLCMSCHGSNGQGNVELKAPAIAGLPEWYLTAQLKKFKAGVRGKNVHDEPGMRMRPMAMTVSDSDIDAVSQYVAELKPAHLEQTIHGDVTKGQQYFAVCMACHGAKGEGNAMLKGPPLARMNDWYIQAQIHNFKKGIRANDPTKDPVGATMVPMANTLPDDQAVKDVISYIQTLR